MEDSLRIPGLGAYSGEMDASEGSDWYKWKLPSRINQATCLDADVATNAAVGARLVSVDNDVVREVKASTLLDRPTRMGLVSPGLNGGFLRVHATAPLAATLPYDFAITSLQAKDLPAGDGGSGLDASSEPADALAVPGACFGGTLDPAAGDDLDVYSFTVEAGDRVVVSLADETGEAVATLTDAAGAVLASAVSGALAAASITTSGTYYVSMSSSSTTTYVLGVCEPNCEPPENPCRPMCALIISDM